MYSPKIAITLGEPAGIGPEITLQVLQQNYNARIVLYADPKLVQQYVDLLNDDTDVIELDPNSKWPIHQPGTVYVAPVSLMDSVVPGQLDVSNAQYVLNTLRRATLDCKAGIADAIVTAPLHKGIINDAGVAFTGHTEYLADLTNAKLPVMMLMTEGLRVALATTHLPLSEVSSAITQASLEDVLTIIHKDMQQRFAIEKPAIYVCGLNPHAGEGGHLGREEIEVIEPVLDKLRGEGMNIEGPLPADTLFSPKNLESADVVLAMYHDQGLPVLKYKGFGQAINITLGLPIIRTSVDHGTALDLAGKGVASSSSMQLALDTAIEMASNKKPFDS